MNKDLPEQKKWFDTSKLLGDFELDLGRHWGFNFINDPKRLCFVLSRYKFVAKMICENSSILELGCSEGIGVPILTEYAKSYLGIDSDKDAIYTAEHNFLSEKIKFICDNFLGKQYSKFDAIVSLDVIEHIYPKDEKKFFETIFNNLSENGVCIIGTPNVTASEYASEHSQLGHVNLFSQQRLVEAMKRYFYQVFPFGINDEVVHTGYSEMCHYLACLGCHKKEIIE